MKKGWQKKKLDEVCEVEYGTRVVQKRDGGTIYPVYGGGGATFSMDSFNREDRVVVARFGMSEQCTRFVAGKFFLNDSGLTLAPKNSDTLLPTFLDKWLFSSNDEIFAIGKGTAQKNLDVAAFRCLQVPQPPLPEQKRIVDILDKAFAAISTAKANTEKNLQNARELFESYLQSVFANPGDGWETEKMVEVCSIITCGVASTPKYVDASVGIPFLSAQNVKNGEVVLDKYKFISREFHEKLTKNNKPTKGDILYSRVGAKYGEAGVVEHDFDFSVYVSLTLIRPIFEKLNNYFLKYYLISPVIKSLAKKSIQSSGVPNLNVKDVREFPATYPSLEKQHQIVNQIETLLVEIKKIENIYQQKIKDLRELKKSVLQKAFNGGL